MAIDLSREETAALIPSLQKYFREELELELSELRARLLLDFILQEVAPFAYNRGVNDAEAYLRARLEDLSGSCYEPGLTYWLKKRK